MRLACLAFLVLTAPAAAQDRYVGVFVGSQHIGSDEFNNFNPGLTLGRRRPIGNGTVEAHVEGGVFYNSYEEVSPIVVVGLSTGVAQIGPGQLRLGASIGTAYYKELSETLDDDVPTLGPFVPIGAVTAAYRVGRGEYRLSVLPPSGEVDTVLNFSVAIGF